MCLAITPSFLALPCVERQGKSYGSFGDDARVEKAPLLATSLVGLLGMLLGEQGCV
jgi:hypothetical protein